MKAKYARVVIDAAPHPKRWVRYVPADEEGEEVSKEDFQELAAIMRDLGMDGYDPEDER